MKIQVMVLIVLIFYGCTYDDQIVKNRIIVESSLIYSNNHSHFLDFLNAFSNDSSLQSMYYDRKYDEFALNGDEIHSKIFRSNFELMRAISNMSISRIRFAGRKPIVLNDSNLTEIEAIEFFLDHSSDWRYGLYFSKSKIDLSSVSVSNSIFRRFWLFKPIENGFYVYVEYHNKNVYP
jgi:hypothetical protein